MMRELIHHFKFGGRRSLFRVFSELLLVHKASYIREHDAIIPVPLSQARFRERGFNQSYMIGKTIATSTNIPFFGNILLRRGRSKPQSSIKSLRERRENLTDRFFLRKKGKEMVRGKSILLIDDVLTTGATASACARVLYPGGAVRVNLLSITRALREP
ncbi:MAG: ComF family protein [Spirochaetota bacterium]